MTGVPIAFAANRGFALWGSRRILLARLRDAGHELHLLTTRDEHSEALVAEGAHLWELPIVRGGLHAGSDGAMLRSFLDVYRRVRPALAHHFHAKPVLLGSVAARLAGVPHVINTVTGIGESLPEVGVARIPIRAGYRFAGETADFTIFQNSDDLALFLKEKLVPPGSAELICSSGVDVERFRPYPDAGGGAARVLFMSRLLHSKGVGEFIGAARMVRKAVGEGIRFEMAGEWDLTHPDRVTEEELRELNFDGAVDFVGYCKDPSAWLQGAMAFVCPSFYREGVPRTILEASACGVPVIGADSPGIRDVVVHGETGFLVPPQDSGALAEGILSLFRQEDRGRAFGRAARTRMLESFDIQVITNRYLDLYARAGLSNARVAPFS